MRISAMTPGIVRTVHVVVVAFSGFGRFRFSGSLVVNFSGAFCAGTLSGGDLVHLGGSRGVRYYLNDLLPARTMERLCLHTEKPERRFIRPQTQSPVP